MLIKSIFFWWHGQLSNGRYFGKGNDDDAPNCCPYMNKRFCVSRFGTTTSRTFRTITISYLEGSQCQDMWSLVFDIKHFNKNRIGQLITLRGSTESTLYFHLNAKMSWVSLTTILTRSLSTKMIENTILWPSFYVPRSLCSVPVFLCSVRSLFLFPVCWVVSSFIHWLFLSYSWSDLFSGSLGMSLDIPRYLPVSYPIPK
jgi:hypothetical protein